MAVAVLAAAAPAVDLVLSADPVAVVDLVAAVDCLDSVLVS